VRSVQASRLNGTSLSFAERWAKQKNGERHPGKADGVRHSHRSVTGPTRSQATAGLATK